jgi:hypothetical protein
MQSLPTSLENFHGDCLTISTVAGMPRAIAFADVSVLLEQNWQPSLAST